MIHRKGFILLFSSVYTHRAFISTDAERVGVASAEQLFVLHLRTGLSPFVLSSGLTYVFCA